MQTQLAPAVAKKFLTFLAKEAAGDRNNVIALFEDEFAGDQTGAPFIDFVSMLAAVGSDIFLHDAVNYPANSAPHAAAGAHRAGLMLRIDDKLRHIPPFSPPH